MAKYIFRAKDWAGKMIKGELELSNVREVAESLRSNGLIPLEIEIKNENIIVGLWRKITGKISGKLISNFTRQLATMMTAGLPMTDALALLKNQQEVGSSMYLVLDKILSDVRGGMSLGNAMEKYLKVFGQAYVASIAAGEEAGVLEEILSKLATNLENENEFQGKVKGAMIYPTIVIVGMLAVMVIMMIFVIPKLTGLYADFGTAKMPAITRGLMAVSTWMAKLWFLFPILFAAPTIILKIGAKNPSFNFKKDKFMLGLPIMGKLTQTTILASTCRTLSMLLTAGISLVEALRIVATVSGNDVYKKAYNDIAEKVQKGFGISVSFENTGVFPVIVTQMVATGEATGKLDEVLLKVANYFSVEAEQSVSALTSAIEPLIMVVLGIGVGFLVVAVVMPIYNLTSSF
ncbi:MAG: type II secretion system F family protein [Candidatus Shapirobacteria bacterium]